MKEKIANFARWIRPQNTIANSIGGKVFKVTTIASFALVTAVFLFVLIAAWIKRMTPEDEPTAYQQQQIDRAISVICRLDEVICKTATTESIQYKVLNLSAFLDIGRAFYWSHYAVTHRTETGYQISFTSHLFDDLSALSVFMFHELQHIRSSDFELYEDANRKKEECIDHNFVKQSTSAFTEKLEAWLHTPEGRLMRMNESPIVFAKLPGNTIKDCT